MKWVKISRRDVCGTEADYSLTEVSAQRHISLKGGLGTTLYLSRQAITP